MRATILNCTLKAAPETSNTEALAVVGDALSGHDVEVEGVIDMGWTVPGQAWTY